MLSSGANQYLRPEYLTPLPTTLDAKKSPLALLAQTCSQIGADTPNSKLLQQSSSDKSKSSSKSESSREKSSPTSSASNTSGTETPLKSSFKPYESSAAREKTRSPEDRSTSSSVGSRVRTPVAGKTGGTSTPSAGGRCASNHSAASPAAVGRKTPASESGDATKNSMDNSVVATPKAIHSPGSMNSAATTTPVPAVSDPALKDLPLGTYKPTVPVSSAFLTAGGYPSAGLPLPMDLMASGLMSQHALKSGALNPYLSYARMKTPSGTDALVPVCRDPYCTGCSLSSHLFGAAGAKTPTSAASCPAGCAQCDHGSAKAAAAAAAASAAPAYLGHHGPAAAAYAHAQLAALAAASQLPYVCNWIAGDAAYCGKRFGTSEELLQHLRTHTSLAAVSEAGGSSLSMLSPHPLLHRTYPTPPLSPLATARYHPYSKPSLLPPALSASSLAAFPLTHPSLSPYFAPYSLYGPRLGAASTMHP